MAPETHVTNEQTPRIKHDGKKWIRIFEQPMLKKIDNSHAFP
jgi:hypothetical protein